MDLALISLKQIAAMFVIVIIGIICSKTDIITEKGNKTISAVVLNVVNPAVIFMSYQVDFDKRLLMGLGISIFLSVLTFAMAILVSNIAVSRKNNADYNVERIALVYSNCGFIGIPLVNALIGSEGVFYMAAYLTVFNILLWTHGVVLMTGIADFRAACRALITPCIIAIFVGIVFFVTGIRLPGFTGDAIGYLGDMNTPLAMLAAGATIARTNMAEAVKNVRMYIMVLIKLFIMPVLAVILVLPFAKLGVSRAVYLTIIIAVACPTGASGTLFALRYDKNAVYASEIFGATTFLSAVSIPLILLLADVAV